MSDAGVWATVVIALFTVAIFFITWLQHRHDIKVARANINLALYERRMDVYMAIESCFISFLREGRPKQEEIMKLLNGARYAHFLFPKNNIAIIDEIREQTLRYQSAFIRWEPLRARAYAKEILSDDEKTEKEHALAQMKEVQNWFVEQIDQNRLRNEFAPFLVLPYI